MTTPRQHADLAVQYFMDNTTNCWARNEGSNNEWTLMPDPRFNVPGLEYYVGHEPPPPIKRTITLTVNGSEWELPAPLTDDAARKFYYISEANSVQAGRKGIDYYDNLRAHIQMNGGSIYATEADAQAWAGFDKWCRGGGA